MVCPVCSGQKTEGNLPAHPQHREQATYDNRHMPYGNRKQPLSSFSAQRASNMYERQPPSSFSARWTSTDRHLCLSCRGGKQY
eukprot:1139057-Pelagomonas_calceolata.AAC.6